MEDQVRPDLAAAAPAAMEDPIRPDLAAPAAMANLISLVNNLQRACTALGDHGEKSTLSTIWDALPSIAIVGGQSSGKSSVLESFVGKDFLPRGSGIVTRRPLILQLHRIDGTAEYAEFLHQPMKRYIDFAEVRKEIADETDRETGRSKGISSVPIHLSIFSPNVVNLSLIDLPGLTKIAVDGQSDNIVQEIESMVRAFIEKPNCIILAVSPANQDLATSDAIKISREVDPKGERTFGVLTKIDLMDKGTDAVDILEGRSYRLQFPWIGVVNRSQQDINKSVDMIAARRRERDYFANTPEYKHLAHRMGSEHLAKSLSKHLECLIKSRIGCLLTTSCIKSRDTMKNKLQGYIHRAYDTFPSYGLLTKRDPYIAFKCTVKVGDVEYISDRWHKHLREAEEDVAGVAFKSVMGNETIGTLLELIKKDSISTVNLLKEYAKKKHLSSVDMVFDSSRVVVENQTTLWISTLKLDGRHYLGEVSKSKKESLRRAAIEAVGSLLEDGNELMINVVASKRLRHEVPRPASGHVHGCPPADSLVAV